MVDSGLSPRVREIIERVSKGSMPEEAISDILFVKFYTCVNCHSRNATQICEVCGATCIDFKTLPATDGSEKTFAEFVQTQVIKPKQVDVKLTLGCLRPGDRFLFLTVIPFEDIDRNIEYTVSPAKRGYISWTSQYKKVYKCPLPYAFFYPVKLLNDDHIDPERRFYPGDHVKLRDSRQKGVVVKVEGEGYVVSFEGDEQWVPSNNLLLIYKDKTTKAYIRKQGEGWVVAFANFSATEKSFPDALTTLYRNNKTAFNRFSKYLKRADCPIKIDEDVLRVLREFDSRLWG